LCAPLQLASDPIWPCYREATGAAARLTGTARSCARGLSPAGLTSARHL